MPKREKARAERARLAADTSREENWKRWGPYLAERQWGTVREDYSADGDSWRYFPHDDARSRAYRWGEDGLLGITDRECRLCFALSLWNGRDAILKERLFGLSGTQGNHGEDVKELYFYLDSTPTHSYMKALYKYPQAAFPYERLVEENRRRTKTEGEFEIYDTGIFEDGRYFDVYAEYAKASPNDLLVRITAVNRGPAAAQISVLPTLWFRNTWVWGCRHEGCTVKPAIELAGPTTLSARHETLGAFTLKAGPGGNGDPPEMLFTENETNSERLFSTENHTPYTKDAFHDYVIGGRRDAVNPRMRGTKAAALYRLDIPAGGAGSIELRLFAADEAPRKAFGKGFDAVISQRKNEADAFYRETISDLLKEEERSVARQAYAGLLWSKQFYHYVVEDWLSGDANTAAPPASRLEGRNRDWPHVFNRDVLSMPDKWEYPWFAAWDLAFHMIPFARIDPDFAKKQLLLLLREWYMHPNGQIPAYEYGFGDVNPPVHAWACWRVYKMTGSRGHRDRAFLASAFQKLLLNFTWWVNRKDVEGRHIFSGGFLGLDNIGVFDRSRPVAGAGRLDQADGTAWMAFYCATMLSMALELAGCEEAYEDLASKFFEHFIHITDAMNTLGGTGLWDEKDGFYYDWMRSDEKSFPLRIRSIVGLLPLIAVEVLDENVIEKLPGFRKRTKWFLENRKELRGTISYLEPCNPGGEVHAHRLLAVPSRERLVAVLEKMLDENEFLSPFGVRSLSLYHRDNPYTIEFDSTTYSVGYLPGESDSGLFGGNSNWRGPIWFPLNFLLIEALERYNHFYGESLKVECPTGSGRMMTLKEVAREIASRMCRLFQNQDGGGRACHGRARALFDDQACRDLVLFHEYYHADTGEGLGASHQTGWTALVVRLLEDMARTTSVKPSAAAVSGGV